MNAAHITKDEGNPDSVNTSSSKQLEIVKIVQEITRLAGKLRELSSNSPGVLRTGGVNIKFPQIGYEVLGMPWSGVWDSQTQTFHLYLASSFSPGEFNQHGPVIEWFLNQK